MILGTAGHIDHGKSALIEALTGRRMDPFAEEQRRGITLDLHAVPLPRPGGEPIGVVDVPGHEDLIRTMAAGAAGMDLVLLVIAADEGIMPQTREHLAIVEQFGVRLGIPVLSKIDLVEPGWLDMVRSEVVAWLSGSPVRFTEPVAVSARTGLGIGSLLQRIHALADEGERRGVPEDFARLPIDRVLSVPGTGTVVTGTSWSGTFHVGDAVRILPGGQETRIRTLEGHGRALQAGGPGRRLAVGLSGVDHQTLRRGDVLVAAGDPWRSSRILDVEFRLRPDAPRSLEHQTRVRVHHGTAETIARVHTRGPLRAGEGGPVRLVLETPVVARGGDRVLVRSYSPMVVIGGGRVLDPAPPPGRPHWPVGLGSELAEPRLVALAQRRPMGIAEEELPVLLGLPPAAALRVAEQETLRRRSGAIVHRGLVDGIAAEALALVLRHQEACPAEPGLSLETVRQTLRRHGAGSAIALAEALGSGRLLVEGGFLRTPDFRPSPSGGDATIDRVVRAVEAAGLSPPSVAELETELRIGGVADALRLAARQGRLVPVERDRYFAPAALERFVAALREIGGRGTITPAAAREVTGLSRKFLIPLLEWADQRGITRRAGEARILVRPN